MIHSRVYHNDHLHCNLPLEQIHELAAEPEARIWLDLEQEDDSGWRKSLAGLASVT